MQKKWTLIKSIRCREDALKISHIETLCLSRMHNLREQWVTTRYRTIKADCTVVIVHTDDGRIGIGEATSYGWPLQIRQWVEFLSPILIGCDPTDPGIAPSPHGLNRAHDAAVAGIDCALWDLRARVAEKSICELISGHQSQGVRVYASSGCRYDWRFNPEQLFSEAEDYIERGFPAMKFRLGTEWKWDGITVNRFLDHVRELHRIVDGRMDLALDGNCRLDEDQSLAVAKELDRLGFAWFEEPMPWKDPTSYARLNRAVDLPITGGESFATLAQLQPYLDMEAYATVQPDAGLSGITEMLRIGAMALERGVKLYPHSWHNGLMGMANGHVVAALPVCELLEVCMIQGPLQWGIFEDPPILSRGFLRFPDEPGLGVRLAANLEAKYPYIEGHYALTVERAPVFKEDLQ